VLEIETLFTSAKNLGKKMNRKMYFVRWQCRKYVIFPVFIRTQKRNIYTGNEFMFMLNITLFSTFEKDYLKCLMIYLSKCTFYSKHKIWMTFYYTRDVNNHFGFILFYINDFYSNSRCYFYTLFIIHFRIYIKP
jgi:hypothetical protein